MSLPRKEPLPLSLLYFMNCFSVIYVVFILLYFVLQHAID